ncbi:MAG: RHS repeat-associated core domain-containing protein [Lachnospirales bacterium]
MSKTVDGVLTQQICDGDNIVSEANSSNTILKSYTRGHKLLTDDDRRAYMYDSHGNLVQQNRGTTAENVTRYDVYGNKIEKSGATNDTPFGYCGEIVKRWVTVNGVDKNVEKYDYSAYPYVRPDESIMNIPNSVYDDNGNLINISTANDEMNVSGLNDDKIRYVINALSDNLYQKSNTKVYNMQSSTSNNYKNYVNYFFDEYGKTIETKNFADNVNYLTVTDFYRDVYSPYPSNRTITTESYIIREETSYQAGNLYEKTTKDNNGNVIAYERTDYDYGKFSEGHYGLPIKSQSKISSTQINLVENTLTDKGRSIGETKAYLQTNGNKDLKSKSVYSYNASMPGRVTEEKNYINNSAYVSTAYTYNNTTAKPIISKFTSDGVNYDTTYEYDTLGQLKKVVYPNSLTTNYEYDNIGNITKESSSGGTISTVKTFVYDYTGNTLIVTNENGKKVKYNYDQTGNLISVMDMENGNNVLESYTYDSYLRPITQTSGGAVTTLSYDNRDRVTGKITKGGNNKLAQENYSYAINATGLLTTTTVVGDSNACSYSTSVQQDVLGRTVSETNRQGGVTKYSYDMAGNVIKKVPPTGNGNYSLTYTYDTAGNVLSETETGEDIDTSTKIYTYDMLGRMTTSTDGMGKKTTYTYCGTDWVKTIQTPFSGTSYGQTSYTYDKSGNVTSESVKTSSSSARTTTYTYDLLNRVTESKLNGVSTTYTYDKVGNVLSTTMANGTQTVKYAYDQLNRPVKYTDALGKSETYKYNNYGDMTSKVDRNGVTTNYTYDGLHRLTSEKAVKNGVTSAKYFTYALTGQLVWESNGSLAKSYSYAKDNLGKIYSDESYTLNGLNYRTRRLYNIADMNNYVQTFRSDVSYSIYTLNYSFDSKGRLYMFSSQSASEYSVGSKYDIYYTYDKNDNIKTGKTRGGVTTEYSYNDANMLTSLVNKKGTTTYSTYSYNYNLDGNINRKVESGKATDYVYDGTGRLSNEKITNGSAVTNMTYGYDNAGNRSSLTVTGTENYVTTYSYDKNNRLLKDSKKNNGASYADVTLYSYDNNGNQLRKDQSRDDLTSKPKMGLSLATFNSGYGYEKFTYNGFNQLTAFEDEAGNKATYEYYSDGLRLSKTVNGAKSSYIWTDNNLSMEIKSDEVISYAKAPGYMRTGSSKDSLYRNDKLYLFNGHGDVTSMVDKSGKVTKTYSYDAFGNEINRDKNDTNPFRYCGEYWDNETESIYLRARYYNPSIGRFTTEDPIKDGSNWYAYCSGNPIMFWDPSGKIYEYEQKMYENGEMAPMAYTYLMKQTYDYLLAKTQKEKDKIKNDTDAFRKSGYKTTGIAKYDEGIKRMPTKPSAPISEDEHFFRNELNLSYSYEDLQKINKVAPNNVKWNLYPPEKSALHQNTSDDNSNKKYVTADGHFEVVYDKNGKLLSENYYPVDMGTYNYGVSATEHTELDIVPYYQYKGNVKNSGESPFRGTYDYYIGNKLNGFFK